MLWYNMQNISKHMMHFYVIKGNKDHWTIASSTGYVFANQSYAPNWIVIKYILRENYLA